MVGFWEVVVDDDVVAKELVRGVDDAVVVERDVELEFCCFRGC